MCGITGIYGINDRVKSSQIIKVMNKSIAHRGPDDEGFFVDDSVAFGHRRLAIIDLSPAGHQPMQCSENILEIIFNGEIYNFNDVKKELAEYPFKTKTDTEVILAAYKKWGKQCVHKFNGMFAFVIYNKDTKELFIARDRLGVKPVYYYKTNELFVFASEVRALLESGLVPRKINLNALRDYFSYQTIHAPQCIVKDVLMLMPGHYATIKGNKLQIEEYWSVTKNISNESEGKSYTEVCADVNKLFYESVERRLVSDVPFGAFLSGGIDSSAVVGMMSKIMPQKVKTFTIVFDEEEFSEAKFAKMVADKFNTDHHEFLLTPEDFLQQLPEAMNALDHPSGDGPNSYIVSKITRNAGITMALSGLGGDEFFAGYPVFKRHLSLQNKKWLWSLPASFRKIAAGLIVTLKKDVSTNKFAQLLSAPSALLIDTFPIFRQVSATDRINKFLKTNPTDDAVHLIVEKLLREGNFSGKKLTEVSVSEISTYMQNVLLRDADQMSMAVALEVRVPFLDYKLAEYVLGVKDEYKMPTYPKKLFVESMGDLLPHEVVHRPKMGFVFPWAVWLKKELREMCNNNIQSLANRSFIDGVQLKNQWQRFLNNDPSVRWLDMWLSVVLEHWLAKNKMEV
ncbi:MAG TPA: asparagine synthase (glutamine-hydrolyzing) [Bacteroidia bacterium]|nr:asparagine synthase (glutamine-hydrolyzing) [Bacteroidia bacterium]HNU32126.1 asparagine synthase (glutamine-hydrolyzing) [Bacteroidia bacterium]